MPVLGIESHCERVASSAMKDTGTDQLSSFEAIYNSEIGNDSLQDQNDLEYARVLFTFTEVAKVLKGKTFLQGVKKLFADYGAIGSDGVQRVGSNGFLKLTMEGKLVPSIISNMDVLQCVEICLDRGSMERAHHSGLLFDTFVECLGRLAMCAYTGVTPDQVAELLMLQLDQFTRCLTSRGVIQRSTRLLNNRAQAEIEAIAQKRRQGEQNGVTVHSSRSQKREHEPFAGQKQKLSVKPSEHVFLTKDSDEVPSPLSGSNIPVPRMAPPPSPQSGNFSDDDSLVIGSVSEWAVKQKSVFAPRSTCSPNPEDKMESFLRRMEQDKLEREEKISQMRRVAIRENSTPTTKNTSLSAEKQAKTMERLHASRKKHFETKRDKYQTIRTTDAKTGQPLFKPRLISKPLEELSRCGTGSSIDSDSVNTQDMNRFDRLHAEALTLQQRKTARLRANEAAQRRLAEAPKSSSRSRQVFAKRIVRDLGEAFESATILADSSILNREQATILIGELLGISPVRTTTDQVFLNDVITYLFAHKSGGSLQKARFLEFAAQVGEHDPASFRENLMPKTDANKRIHEFRQRLMAQRKFAHAMRKSHVMPDPTPKFVPQLCEKSRDIDEKRKLRDAATLSREQDLIQRRQRSERAIAEMRIASAENDASIKECTFHPKISHRELQPPVPQKRTHRLCRQSHGGLSHTSSADLNSCAGSSMTSRRQSCGSIHFQSSLQDASSHSGREDLECKSASESHPRKTSPRRKSLNASTPIVRPRARPFTYASMMNPSSRSVEAVDGKDSSGDKEKYSSTVQMHWEAESITPLRSKESNEYKIYSEAYEPYDEDLPDDRDDMYTEIGSHSGAQEDQSIAESVRSDDSDELLFYADVQVRKQVHRIPVYENDDLRKVAARFSALHNLSARVEQALFAHLVSLIEAFP